ncbi:MBL fold metallo-hydrolase [Amphibacillus sp. Q70]|uniref:MBL fold metallo-hydrolase n=1 Tax=Amphibacillus sp. Q70 TaxID=3453416 RepID=UPI003F825EB0
MNLKNLMDENIEVVEIDKATWMISEGIGRSRAHCYLVEGNNQAALIDTGLHVIEMKSIVEKLTDKETVILSTHGHIDHVSNHYQFDKIYLNGKDDAIYDLAYNSELRATLLRGWFMSKGVESSEFEKAPLKEYLIKQTQLPPKKDYEELSEKQIIELGNRSLEVIETPGHTVGSVSFLDSKFKRLFIGDTICEDGVLLHFKESTSVATYLESLKKLINRKDEFDELYAGPQLVSLPTSIIEDFIGCAELIIDNKDNLDEIAIKEQDHYSVQYKKARLTVPIQ